MTVQRFLVVELEADLPAYRRVGLFCAIRQHPGVLAVGDLSAISRETLDAWLLQPDPEPVAAPERVVQMELA